MDVMVRKKSGAWQVVCFGGDTVSCEDREHALTLAESIARLEGGAIHIYDEEGRLSSMVAFGEEG